MSAIVSNDPANTNTDANTTATSNRAYGVEHQRLFYLHDLPDFKVHHDDPDVRGWKLQLDSGDVVGTVDNLIVDKAMRKVRYLEVKTDDAFSSSYRDRATYLDKDYHDGYKAGSEELTIVPVGMVRLDHGTKTCLVNGVTADAIGLAPRYRRGSELRPQYEIETLHHYDNDASMAKTAGKDFKPFDRTAYRDFDHDNHRGLNDEFYSHRMFDTDSYYDKHSQASRPASL